MSKTVEFIDLGLAEYKSAWDFQEENLRDVLNLRDSVVSATQAGKLIFCEHPHVYTLGKSGEKNNLLINDEFLKKINATYYRSNRGGDITYHGPGQIVGYPVFDLEKLNMGVKQYINNIEEAIILTLAEYSIPSSRLNGATGVWLDAETTQARKICAIGVRVSRAVTMHGFALNVNTDLNYFSYINPCGFQDKGITSIQKELGHSLALNDVKLKLKKQITAVFQLEVKSNRP
jgi:lipoyl(octanoyl) transferase